MASNATVYSLKADLVAILCLLEQWHNEDGTWGTNQITDELVQRANEFSRDVENLRINH